MPRTEQDTAMRPIGPPGGPASSVDSSLDDSETSGDLLCDFRFSAAPRLRSRGQAPGRADRGWGQAAAASWEAGVTPSRVLRFPAFVRYNLETIRWVTSVGAAAGKPPRTRWWGDVISPPRPAGLTRRCDRCVSRLRPMSREISASGEPPAGRRGGTKFLHTACYSCRYNGWKHKRELAPRQTP